MHRKSIEYTMLACVKTMIHASPASNLISVSDRRGGEMINEIDICILSLQDESESKYDCQHFNLQSFKSSLGRARVILTFTMMVGSFI